MCGIVVLFFALASAARLPAAEHPQPVVNYQVSFENVEFLKDDFIKQSGLKTIKDRQLEFPEGRFGRGIRMNYIPQVPDDDNMSGIDLDLITAVMFNTRNFSEMGFNEPFLWGAGRLNPRLGAIAFWAKGKQSFPGPLFEQSSIAFGRKERDLIGIGLDDDNCLTAYVRDARYVRHELLSEETWNPNTWNHLVFNWDWAKGLELWLNGKKIASSWGADSWFETMYPGLFHLPSSGIIYDELYLMDRPLSGGEIERLMERNVPPGLETPSFMRTREDLERITACSGADRVSDFPAVTPESVLRITEVWPVDARDEHIPGWYVSDGRNEMAWPHEYAFFTIIPGDADYHAEKVDLVSPPGAPVNYVVLTGNLADVRVQAGTGDMKDTRDLFSAPASDRFLYGTTIKTTVGSTFRIPFTEEYGTPRGFEGDINLPLSGAKRIQEVGLYHVASVESVPEGMHLVVSPITGPLGGRSAFSLKALTSRDERRVALATANPVRRARQKVNIGAFRRLNIFSEPFDQPTGIDAITLTIPVRTAEDESALYIRVHDPAVPSRLWNHFALNMKGYDSGFSQLKLVIDFNDLVLTGGDRLWIDIGCAGKCEVLVGDEKNPAALTVTTMEPYIAVDAYAEKEIIPARVQYAKMYEYLPWKFSGRKVTLERPYMFGGPFDIFFSALAVKRVNPDHFEATFMETMCGSFYTNGGRPTDPAQVPLKTIVDPHGAPAWAVYMRDYNASRHAMAAWWSERQNPDGQVGGGWNDDTLFMSAHMGDLPLDGCEHARAIIDTIHTKMEKTRLFKDGFCNIYPIDRMHTGDFISERYNTVVNNLGQAYAAEREMASAWHAGHPERTPRNYGEGKAFLSSANVLHWYWGLDMPREPYVSKPLEEAAKELRLYASCLNEIAFHRYTASNVHRDDYRPYGSSRMFEFLLGGQRGIRWDAHVKLAVMWPSGGGPDVARIVLRADNRSLTAVCYSFDNVKRDLAMRLCRLDDGRYRIGLYADENGAGNAGEALWETERDVRRFDVVMLPVPPRTPLIIKVEQIQKYTRPGSLPDLAIDPWDVKSPGADCAVTVHNIGNAPAERVLVRLVDGEDMVGEREIPGLDAPVDFVPKKTVVTFEDVPVSAMLRVIVDPENAIDEILEENNAVFIRKP